MISDEAVEAAVYAFEAFGAGMADALEAAVPYLAPDRETILNAMLAHIYEGESIPLIRQGMPQNEWTLLSLAADAVVSLLTGSEVDTPSSTSS